MIPGAAVRRFAYDACGNPPPAADSRLVSAADAITDLLYSGEATDPTGRQYLRARGYDPTTGRFNRLDPFAGLAHEPQSLHKYLYAHADPIMGVDPTGRAVSAAIGVGLTAWGMYDTAMSIKDLATRVAAGAELRGARLNFAVDAALSVGAGRAFGLAAKGLGRLAAKHSKGIFGDVARWWQKGRPSDYYKSLSWTDRAWYELGQNTLHKQKVARYRDLDPVSRGKALWNDYGTRFWEYLSTSGESWQQSWTEGPSPGGRGAVELLAQAGVGVLFYQWLQDEEL